MKTKTPFFYAIAIALPFAILFLLELILAVSGFGQRYPLFIPSEQIEGHIKPNPNLIKRYFGPSGNAPKVAPDTYLFKKEKPTNTIRIVTMGGSTMAGFPYGRFASPAGMLQQRFKAEHPTKNIEIISVAMSSINTYTLLDITEEVIEVSPDAVLIYTGHNEFLGVMGVGSNYSRFESHAANLLFLKLKDLRIFQLLQSVVSFINSAENSDGPAQNSVIDTTRTVMAQVAKNKHIVYQDKVYQSGIQQFTQNINMILGKFAQSEVPVFISNLVANENDLQPFESISDSHLDKVANRLLSLDSQLQTAVLADDVNKANRLYHANYFYGLGKRFEVASDMHNALGYYTKALDYDLLRFRAPSEFTQIIKDAASNHNAVYVDSSRFIRQQASSPIIGNQLMLEHLHPNHQGYFLLGESFYQSLKSASKNGINESLEALGIPEFELSVEQAWALTPITRADEIYADYKIAQLTSDYPFTSEKQNVSMPVAKDSVARIAVSRINGVNWIDTQQALLAEFQTLEEFTKAANVAGILFDALPNQGQIARVASLLYLRENILPMALYYAKRAVSMSPNESNYRLSLAEIYFKLGQKQTAIKTLQEVISRDPNNQRAKQILTTISN